MQTKLLEIANIFGGLELSGSPVPVYHYNAPDASAPHYCVWSEDDRIDGTGDNIHPLKAWQGTFDLYTVTEFDPLADEIEELLESYEFFYRFEGADYEEETGLIHYQWVWSYA